MQERRFQVGRSDSDRRGPLRTRRLPTYRELAGMIRKVHGRGDVRWTDGDHIHSAGGPRRAAVQMVQAAKHREHAARFRTVADDPRHESVHLYRLIGEVADLTGPIPNAARRTTATKRTLAYHLEISLVYPTYKTLGLYVPRPLKADEPPGWDTGDPWPAGSYASEHAWAAADDAGKEAPGGGYDSGPDLFALLSQITRYVRANWDRLKVDEHIFNGRKYEALAHPGTPYREGPYTGSDHHDTHTHTQFADHGGRKPPWL